MAAGAQDALTVEEYEYAAARHISLPEMSCNDIDLQVRGLTVRLLTWGEHDGWRIRRDRGTLCSLHNTAMNSC